MGQIQRSRFEDGRLFNCRVNCTREPVGIHARVGTTHETFWLLNATCLHQRPCVHLMACISAVEHGYVAHPTATVALQRELPNPVRPPATVHAAFSPPITTTHRLAIITCKIEACDMSKEHLVKLNTPTTENRGL
ncbi:hypothetical protein V6N12_016162 [Hibiscus sabdariffa]|uniref:Uncharacterized protein n=1 Tax=Hibiscus sabdariffa TaxID=183260 RepID=A0ABR2C8W4_9ROSI